MASFGNGTLIAMERNPTELDLMMNSSDLLNATTVSPPAGTDWAHVKNGFFKAGYVILPFFLIFGLSGNTLTIVTMLTKEFRKITSRYILMALAVSDSALLLTQPFNKLFVQKLFGHDPRAISDLSCKIFFHIFKTAKMTSSWLVVILCFERYVAVVYPLRARNIITKKTILILIAIDYIFIITFDGIWTFSSEVVGGVCKPDVTHPDTKNLYRDFLIAGSSFYSFIPMLFLALFTPQIVYKLIKQRNAWKRRSSQSIAKRQSETTRISVMLIGVMVAYVVCVLPITIVINLAFWKDVSVFDTNTVDFFIAREVAQMLEQLNYALNFCLYVLCSKQFRQRVAAILGIGKYCCKPKAFGDSSSSMHNMTKETDGKPQSAERIIATRYGDAVPRKITPPTVSVDDITPLPIMEG